MASNIEVRVDGRGIVTGGETREDAAVRALCSSCGQTSDVVASLGGGGDGAAKLFACAACLRERLDAMSVARWRLKEARASGIPWGKSSG
jgi:hypothetical protein